MNDVDYCDQHGVKASWCIAEPHDDAGDKTKIETVTAPEHDAVNHPSHYTSHPSGVEAIAITEHFNFNIGNAIKYLWRAGLKGNAIEDLQKAAWYANREVERLSGVSNYPSRYILGHHS